VIECVPGINVEEENVAVQTPILQLRVPVPIIVSPSRKFTVPV
jgi:hypothetical protein